MTESTVESFNLVDRPWVRVRTVDGLERLLSVREVFREARRIERMAGESPQQDIAVLRVLLAAWWSAHRDDPRLSGWNAREARRWWLAQFAGAEDEQGLAVLDDYWERVRPRWDLLGARAPFMQVAGLRTAKDEWASVRKLVPDAESPYFTLRAGAAAESLPSTKQRAGWCTCRPGTTRASNRAPSGTPGSRAGGATPSAPGGAAKPVESFSTAGTSPRRSP